MPALTGIMADTTHRDRDAHRRIADGRSQIGTAVREPAHQSRARRQPDRPGGLKGRTFRPSRLKIEERRRPPGRQPGDRRHDRADARACRHRRGAGRTRCTGGPDAPRGYAGYQRNTDREIPLLICRPRNWVMSNLEAETGRNRLPPETSAGVEILEPRQVPLGGPRAINVRRTLPQRWRSWSGRGASPTTTTPAAPARDGCTTAIRTPGLQTVSWLVRRRDRASRQCRCARDGPPGELNLMTAGAGICHSEVSTDATHFPHGVQLWIALPDPARYTARASITTPSPIARSGVSCGCSWEHWPASVHPCSPTPTARGADRPACRRVGRSGGRSGFEHGLLDRGDATVAGAGRAAGRAGLRGRRGRRADRDQHRPSRPRGAAGRHTLRRGADDVVELRSAAP